MLYGTLLPAPDIGSRPDAIRRMREAEAAGHAVGIHAWDHVDWHDRLPEMLRDEIESVVSKEHARFREVFGRPATLSAAPGWTATPLSVEVQETLGIIATSDTRDGEPFHPVRADGAISKVLEIPTTLPTLDELLALPLPGTGPQVERACESLRRKAREAGESGRTSVHSLHTEIEGGPVFSAPFARLLEGWKSDGILFLTLEELCRTLLSAGTLPARRLTFTTLPGRATPVASGGEGPS